MRTSKHTRAAYGKLIPHFPQPTSSFCSPSFKVKKISSKYRSQTQGLIFLALKNLFPLYPHDIYSIDTVVIYLLNKQEITKIYYEL